MSDAVSKGFSGFGGRLGGKVLTISLFLLTVFLAVNVFLYTISARPEVGLESQWIYNVYIGGSSGLATHSYEEKVWLESINYCEKILCYRMVTTNPTHLHKDYLTGDNMLVRSTIIDKGDGTVYEISYDPPLQMVPQSFSVGYGWGRNSLATVKVVSAGSVVEEKIQLTEVESTVVDKVFLTGRGGVVEGFIIEERTRGVLTKRSIYSPSLGTAVRYEIPVSKTWGELVDMSLRPPTALDFFRIEVFSGFELRHILATWVVLVFLKTYPLLGSRLFKGQGNIIRSNYFKHGGGTLFDDLDW
ncbi:MAG: hypothetical protein NZ570_01215 [Candidatus Caldarchaeum sp.]|nr:hypothetical protein [Candidatus Caldarchaeum sp.]MDW7978071.1 hypothetical protein [Candidatus Caldarchaeum sp.]MDW8360088.1 hypothetical protein [Candidatus Caldarchaeum sp.]